MQIIKYLVFFIYFCTILSLFMLYYNRKIKNHSKLRLKYNKDYIWRFNFWFGLVISIWFTLVLYIF